MNPKVLVGMFLGAMATFVFCAMTMKAVGRAAFGMVEEVRRQFKEKPASWTIPRSPTTPSRCGSAPHGGPEGNGPPVAARSGHSDRRRPAARRCRRHGPAGRYADLWLLRGGLHGQRRWSWDNAKKYIEAGAHGGKGTEAHKAAVVGDTVGDPFKDTSGPSLNILIKLMSMVSVVAAGLIVRYSLTAAMGIF
jgi:K(+)-stimulated pyrophosphate-energized sodium pump